MGRVYIIVVNSFLFQTTPAKSPRIGLGGNGTLINFPVSIPAGSSRSGQFQPEWRKWVNSGQHRPHRPFFPIYVSLIVDWRREEEKEEKRTTTKNRRSHVPPLQQQHWPVPPQLHRIPTTAIGGSYQFIYFLFFFPMVLSLSLSPFFPLPSWLFHSSCPPIQ